MRKRIFAFLLGALAVSVCCPSVRAAEPVENAGIAVGVTAGNMWFLPVKAISMVNGAIVGALSFVLTGGNAELTQQIWRDSSQGPYVITPEIARKAIGQRPELMKQPVETQEDAGMQPQ